MDTPPPLTRHLPLAPCQRVMGDDLLLTRRNVGALRRRVGLCLWLASIAACGGEEAPKNDDVISSDVVFVAGDLTATDSDTADVFSLADTAATSLDGGGCEEGKKTCTDLAHLSTCVQGNWQVKACADSEVCSNLACVSKSCVPGKKRCTADRAAAETCDARGARWAKTLCQIDEACVAGACEKLKCKPGKKTCGGGSTVLTCKAGGQDYDSETCAPQHGCDPGYGARGAQAFCKAHICVPNEAFCVNNKAMMCAADGLEANELENCNKNDSLGKPMACAGGVCLSVKCEPGTFACLGWTSLGKCKADGSAYAQSDCGKGLLCKKGTCIKQVCAPGEAFCEGKIAKKCDQLGTTATVVGDCSVSGSDCVKGVCSKVICVAGKKQCSVDFKSIEVCDSGGYAWVKTPCDAGKACQGGVCKPTLCVPGKGACAGNKPITCDASGTQVTAGADCGAAVCVAGVCKTKDCLAGTTKCQDTKTQLICNSNSVGGVPKPCPAQTACVAGGQCKKTLCLPADAWCDGTVGKTCAADGMSIIAESDCAKSGQTCLKGGCVQKGCGDGQCDKAGGETCANCQKDCGVCPFNGCAARSKAGCDSCACESCVCQLDPNCCSSGWSGFCANLCKTACNGACP